LFRGCETSNKKPSVRAFPCVKRTWQIQTNFLSCPHILLTIHFSGRLLLAVKANYFSFFSGAVKFSDAMTQSCYSGVIIVM
jgi:hypothetical protein